MYVSIVAENLRPHSVGVAQVALINHMSSSQSNSSMFVNSVVGNLHHLLAVVVQKVHIKNMNLWAKPLMDSKQNYSSWLIA